MKTLKAIVIGLPLSCLTLNAMAAVTWVDNRYAHTWGPEKNQYKIGGGHIFDNGAGVLVSAMYDLGQNFDQMKSSFQEYEGWYPLPLNDKWSVTPGGLTDIDSAGTKLAPYISLDYKFNKVLSFSTRYRYNHMTHKDVDFNGYRDYNDSHQIDVFLNYQATDKLWLQLNPEFFVNTGDFHASNGKKTHWEPSIVARYRIDKHWMPYTEIAWLDKDQNNDNQVRLRIGIRYYFQ
ncbi:oligogalacturonate-specific porin KdgM family protein [Pantoea agglomerans]|uniref:oligogalacturonate-specific porin KdgM family protein n=1 Tax=Enterobacter agglomerans TaxID=549 RepID=UPI000E215461|nr:oligogalacturonate-specific porin KdgM family protein [Pantoea agglomerans]MCH9406221.1 porin [Pantoea agglomerans]QTC51871.1 porin [Pantoea agglomerans]WNK32020.1 oligogalacturonate-specific porin KdgM family protein [Pantoea agglomerans]WNK63831.1 oligogalacturonate-specific porin KdgM family protein [Pantoea agglomerans]